MKIKSAIGIRRTTVELTDDVTAVDFGHDYKYFAIRNDGSGSIYVSTQNKECTAGEDEVVLVSSGSSYVHYNGYGGSTEIYLSGTGKATVIAQDDGNSPFKAAQGGGDNVTVDVLNSALGGKADKIHTHTKSEITDFPTSLPASDVKDWAKAATKPTYTASEVGADASGSANTALTAAKAYTDTEIAGLINGAPTTLDTLGEIATAMSENQSVVEALNSAVGTKANVSDLTAHTGNTSNPHSVTKSQIGLGNVGNFKAVSTVAGQGLTEDEKANARTNIGVGTSSFSGDYNDLSNKPVVDTALSSTSTNTVQNKVVNAALNEKADKSKYGDTTINVGRKADTTVGTCSTAEGSNTTASGNDSHAEGIRTIASGVGSHAEGSDTTASGNDSHAEGFMTTTSGSVSHAEGRITTASGDCSHAGGNNAKASGYVSFAHGYHVNANNDNEVAFGKYNTSNINTLFSIGDGTSETDSHNAFEITSVGARVHDQVIVTTKSVFNDIRIDYGSMSFSRITSPNSYTVEFSNPFATLLGVVVSVRDTTCTASSYAIVTDESKTGFTVKASYSNGFEWIAIGTDTIVNTSIGGGAPVG